MVYVRDRSTLKLQNKDPESFNKEYKTPAFFVFPVNQHRRTFLKAPMAHKTYSQEQFLNKYYTLSISFNSNFSDEVSIQSFNKSLYLLLLLRNITHDGDTNLLFLKRFTLSFKCQDIDFMTL